MSKVFRLYNGGASTLEGWSDTATFPYNSTARDTINDPDGASAKNEITSIPSPFARIDLVKTAFREVCKLATRNIQELNGNTIFHKMVSDSLDIGEIFFNIDKFRDKIEIIVWNCKASINTLKADGNPYHFYMADALDKYFVSDAQTYNFSKLQNIYLLNYNAGPNELNIIGATSPATLFFSSANKLDYVTDIYFDNNDRPFDGDFQPLYKRNHDYIKAWWTLRKTIPGFSTLFPEIENYLSLTFKAITDLDFKNQLNGITALAIGNFSPIDAQAEQQINQVEVLGNLLLKRSGKITGESEFAINVDNDIDGIKPLVLPVVSGNKYAGLQYVNGAWAPNYNAPYKEIAELNSRKLPYDGTTFPFLTISDFLEDDIIEVPHLLNTEYYYDGGIIIKTDDRFSYLLPIKPLYFTYFTVNTLMGQMDDGKPAFEMEAVAGGSVNVTIRIPIAGNKQISYIEYQRLYVRNNHADIDDKNNTGGMRSFDFTGLVMPSVQFKNADEAYYTIACVSTFSSKYKFEFYCDGNIIQNVPVDCRDKNGVFNYKAETYTVKHSNIDFIRISDGNGTYGIIVPKFHEHQNLDDFEFSVDLGTSNTHIEFKKAGSTQSSAYEYTLSEALASVFYRQKFIDVDGAKVPQDLNDETSLLEIDFLPRTMSEKTNYYFPTRTVLSYAKTTDWKEKQRPFGLTNFNSTYNKRDEERQYNSEPQVNIKWSNDANAQSIMVTFIENLMLLMRNKVVAQNGNIANTKITWFYPNSMSPRRLNQLREAWDNTYHEFFNQNGNTYVMSESVAPVKYYFKRYAEATSIINIDIGGGTTDVAFSSNGNVDYITSFKFAVNSIFEDSFSDINPHNGIVDWFKNDIYSVLQSKDLKELVKIYNNRIDHPAEMASFLFSLKDNSATKNLAASSIDFDKILQNDSRFKIVFIIFYSAIIYHVAQIVKAKGLPTPRQIAFSGNGSKIIKILSSDTRILSNYTKTIFETVLGKGYETDLDLLGLGQDENPKEVTCKGGLIPVEDNVKQPEKLVMKDSAGHFVGTSDTYSSLDASEKKEIVHSVEEFFNFMFEKMPRKYKFDDNFGVENVTFTLAKDVCKKDLDTFLDKGITLSVTESGNPNNQIEDILSLYPIKGVMQALSTKISEYFSKNK